MNRRALLAALPAATLAACSPLRAFSTLAPRDPARAGPLDVPYGPHPRQRMDIYRPRQPEGPSPILVFFYGGNWDSGRRQDYGWVGHALAAQGFVTAIPDYRLVPEVHYPAFVEDGARSVAALRGLASSLGADADRLAVSGHSAGAYIAAMLALQPDYLAAAGTPPVQAFAGLAGPYDFHPFDVPAAVAAFGKAPDPAATQPVNLALERAPPVFLAHGDSDELVQPRNSRSLAGKLAAAGADVEFKLYPELDHKDLVLTLSRPFRGRAPVLEDMSGFLRSRLA